MAVIQSNGCSSTGLGVVSQYPHGGPEPSVTPVLGNPVLSGLCGHQLYKWHTNILTGETTHNTK